MAASYLNASGATTKEVQAVLGHANASTTLRYTRNVRSRDILRAAEDAMGLADGDGVLYSIR